MKLQIRRSRSATYGAIFLLFLPLFALAPDAGAAPAASCGADAVTIPAETPVYLELTSTVTSKRKQTARGDVIVARVFRDVEVDGRLVVEEGAEVLLLVTDVKKARFLGRKGRLELEPTVVRGVDGTEIPLYGPYERDGKGRKVATAALTVAVAWPFLFLKGKHAKAPAGTVLEARVLQDAFVAPRPQVAEHSPSR